MRASIVIAVFLGLTLVAGTVIYQSSVKAPRALPLPAEPESAAQLTPPLSEEPPQVVAKPPQEPARVEAALPSSRDADPDVVVEAVPQPTPFSRAIETLVSPRASFQQKHDAWRQLQDTGQLDQVIEALEQGVAEHPMAAAYPAALGQAQLYKAGEVAHRGGTISEMGILGMQADQNFDAALKLEPANWEAQFFKAAAMSHWPLELNKGEEVIQRLSILIEQQNRMLPEPQFAQTYVLLGDQYQKMGQPDYAAATWLLGAQQYPGNPQLRQKASGK